MSKGPSAFGIQIDRDDAQSDIVLKDEPHKGRVNDVLQDALGLGNDDFEKQTAVGAPSVAFKRELNAQGAPVSQI